MKRLRVAVSLGAGVLILVHHVWPAIEIDAITLGLVAVGLLPWLTSILESAKFPGGWEVKFREIEEAGSEIVRSHSDSETKQDGQRLHEPELDSNLALVGLRIDLERVLRALSQDDPPAKKLPLQRLVSNLRSAGKIDASTEQGLLRIVDAGNRAAHGAAVEPGVGQWVRESGPRIISALGGTTCARCGRPTVVDGRCTACGYLHDGD